MRRRIGRFVDALRVACGLKPRRRWDPRAQFTVRRADIQNLSTGEVTGHVWVILDPMYRVFEGGDRFYHQEHLATNDCTLLNKGREWPQDAPDWWPR